MNVLNTSEIKGLWGPECVRQGLLATLELSVLHVLICASRDVHAELPTGAAALIRARANPASNALSLKLERLLRGQPLTRTPSQQSLQF
jgi:hypothetical protein